MDGVSGSDIWAVGSYDAAYGLSTRPLAEHWDGERWTVIETPEIEGSFEAVAALASHEVWAVGYSGSLNSTTALAARWDGAGWNTTRSPKLEGYGESRLKAVVAVSPDDIWAVGHSALGETAQALLLHWDGTRWTLSESPFLEGKSNTLNSVAAISSRDAWAVGTVREGDESRPLVERWNGSTWSVVPTPEFEGSTILEDVAALSPSDVWVIGSRLDRSGANFGFVNRAMIMNWDGDSWTVVMNQRLSAPPFELRLEAVSKSDIWYAVSGVFSDPTVGHWDGTRWRKVQLPLGSSTSALGFRLLFDLLAIGAEDVWLVGSSSVELPEQALTYQWDGLKWARVPSPDVFTTED